MTAPLLHLPIRHEHDLVAVRQRARHIAEHLGFDRIEQTRIATAVSEVARNAFMYAKGGHAEYAIEGQTAPQLLVVTISDKGPGIGDLDRVLSGQYQSATGMGLGISGARRLVDRFHIESSPAGTSVTLAKLLPGRTRCRDGREIAALADVLARHRAEGPLGEVQQQNHELLRALEELRARQDELERVNRELEDTNRGVVALYAELDERADHLRRADEIKTRFLSNMSHEFRTPLNSILALSGLLAERLQVDENEKGELYYIRRSAQQLSDLVDDLLDIAKVEAGKIDVRPSHFDVRNLFGALRGMLKPLLVGHALVLTFDDPVDVPPLHTDEMKVSQILRNFISNAIKYTERGEIRVSVVYHEDRATMEFSVSDTGIGIPEADLPRIFDEFVQIENPLQRRTKGTGLGLPLSRRLAELLGGHVSVQSTLGQGSVFQLAVPIVYGAAFQTADPEPEVPAGRIPVLVVEDGEQDLLIYRHMLADSPFHLVQARSTEAAVRTVRTISPAAVILDVRLQEQDEWDLLLRLRRESGRPDLPVIVASTFDDPIKAFGLGANAFARKPVDRGWLLRTLHRLVAPSHALRVLAIDDEEAYRFVIREILNGPEYQLTEAASGEEGLALVGQVNPDVVVLDLNLRGISGYETATRLAASAATADVPVVVVTSQDVSAADKARLPPRTSVLPKSSLSRGQLRSLIRDAVMVSPRPAA